ncbi:hypothetical protein [Thalassotalea sp. SU-HH00458]|uniref:hypothetical protein n=1 Tax=Thalassotalea sp. SU-HH00458 TaxID=3127657 RepID=UPI0031049A3D
MDLSESVGTYRTPLKLNYQMKKDTRELFKSTVTPYKGSDGVRFKDEVKANIWEDVFYLNLVSNRILTKIDIAIAVGIKFLIETNESNSFGEVFWTAESEQSLYNIGEDGSFWVDYRGYSYAQPTPLRNLKFELENLNIFVKNETLIKSLRKLHGLHYITITTKHGNKAEGGDPKVRSEIRHISIYEGMENRKIFRVWRNTIS